VSAGRIERRFTVVLCADVVGYSRLMGMDEEGTLARLVGEVTVVFVSGRGHGTSTLRDAAAAYKVDTDAIALKVKQEFAAKEKAKKPPQSTAKTAKKAA